MGKVHRLMIALTLVCIAWGVVYMAVDGPDRQTFNPTECEADCGYLYALAPFPIAVLVLLAWFVVALVRAVASMDPRDAGK